MVTTDKTEGTNKKKQKRQYKKEARDKFIHFRVSENEYKIISEKAKKENRSVSDYVRLVLFGKLTIDVDVESNISMYDLVQQLKKIEKELRDRR